MLRARRVLLLSSLMVLHVTGLCVAPSGRPGISPVATIEPTLPLQIDTRLVEVERHAGTASARLEIDVLAGGDLQDIDITLTVADGLRVTDESTLPRGRQDMTQGSRRQFAVPLTGPGDRDLPIRLKAVFRTADGRPFELGQGVTLEAPRDAGRSHAGAWEVMAVPLEELRR